MRPSGSSFDTLVSCTKLCIAQRTYNPCIYKTADVEDYRYDIHVTHKTTLQRASSHYGKSESYKNHVQGLVCFVVQDAGANDWHVVGTCSTDLSTSSDKVRGTPVEDCHRYTLQGPTILVLGKSAGEQCYVATLVCTMCTWE